MSRAELGFAIDSSGAKSAAVDLDNLVSAAQRAEKAEQGLGRASSQAQSGIRSLATAVKSLTDAENRMGAGFAQKRAQDIVAYGAELDRLRAKFNPLFAASKAYETSLNELNRAHRVGALGATEYEGALERLNAEFAMVQAGAMRGATGLNVANTAMRQSSGMSRQLMFQMVDLGQTVPLALQSPIFALQNMGFQFAQIGQLYFGQGGMRAALRDMSAMALAAGRAVGRAALALLGMAAANPVVAGIVAIGGAIGVMATGLFDAETATKQADDALADFTGDLGTAESMVRGLETAALAYSEAIGGTATAQTAATGSIIADTRREFQAKQQLLELEIKRREALQADARAGIASAQGRVASAQSSLETLPGITPPPGLSAERVEATRAAQAERLRGMIEEATDEQKRLNAEFTLGDIALNKLREAANMTFEELAAGADKAGAGGGGGGAGGASAADEAAEEAERLREAYADLVGSGLEFIDEQRLEQAAIGMTEDAAARLHFEYELFNRALQAGIELTPKQAAELRTLAGEMAAAEDRTASMAERQRQLEDMTKHTRQTTVGFFEDLRSGVESGKSAWETFKNAALNALDSIINKVIELMSVQSGGSSSGGGLFGSIASGLLGIGSSLFGGGAGVGLFGGTTATFGGGVGTIGVLPSANGNVFHHGNVVPFASGAAFANGIVTKPTIFPMANGAGLMGEAGPEGVLPLANVGGKLGVHAKGGESKPVRIEQTNVFQGTQNADEVRRVVEENNRKLMQSLQKQRRLDGEFMGVA